VPALRAGLLKLLGTELETRLCGATSVAVEYSLVDGYSTPDKLIEIETTAVL